jgi:class 3 adenylate cyclase
LWPQRQRQQAERRLTAILAADVAGYSRVDDQVRQLTRAGCKKVFREVASGAKTDRAQLRRLVTENAERELKRSASPDHEAPANQHGK